MKRKRILYLHSGAELYGADNILYEILKGIDKNKYEIYVLLPCDGPLVEKIQNLGINVEILDYPIIRRKYFNIKGIFDYIINYFKYNSRINSFIKKNEIDIVHVNTLAVLQGIGLRKKRCKIIYHIHEMINEPKLLFKIIYYLICRYSHKVIVVSNAVEKHIHSITKKKFNNVVVIHNGINIDKYVSDGDCISLYNELNIPENSIVVGMIGRINNIKGQDHFIKSLVPIIENNKDIYGVMVGGTFDGQEWRKEKLVELISSYSNNLSDHFKIVDFRNDVNLFYKLFDLFVLPSVKYDSFPTVVLEAMASSLPIVAYKQGGVVEMVEDGINGFLVEWKNIDELSKIIKHTLSNPDIINDMSKHSLRIMREKFSLDVFLYNIEKVYEEVI